MIGGGERTASARPSVASGVRWSLVDATVQQVGRLVITIVLTRLLDPNDFGVLAMALVFTQLATLIGDLGLGPALVQRPTVERRYVTTATTVTLGAGAILAVLLVATSGLVASFYGEPRLQPIVAALAFTYVLRGAAGVPRDLLRRVLAFRSIAVAVIVGVVAGGVVGIALALADAGVWALVASVLVENVVTTIGVIVMATRRGVWKAGLGFDRPAFNELGRFGAFVSGVRIAHYGASNLDNLIVGRVLGPVALGLYNLAYRLMLFPVLRAADLLANVATPALAGRTSVELAQAYGGAVQRVTLVCLPVSVGTAAIAPALVPAVFGERWAPAVVTVQVLALNGPRLGIGRMSGVVHEARRRPDRDLVLVSATLVAYAAAFTIGAQHGIVAVAWAFTVAGYALVPLDQYLVRRTLECSTGPMFRKLLPVGGATLLMGLVAMAVLWAGDRAQIGDGVRAALASTCGAATFVAVLRVVEPTLLGRFIRELSRP